MKAVYGAMMLVTSLLFLATTHAAESSVSHSAHGKNASAKLKRPAQGPPALGKRPGRQPEAAADADKGPKLESVSYDAERGKIKVTLLTENWCNSFVNQDLARMIGSLGDVATFKLVASGSTMKGCVPRAVRAKELFFDVPKGLAAGQRMRVYFGKGQSAELTVPEEAIARRDRARDSAGDAVAAGDAVKRQANQAETTN